MQESLEESIFDVPLKEVQRIRKNQMKLLEDNVVEYQKRAETNVSLSNLRSALMDKLATTKATYTLSIGTSFDPNTGKPKYSNSETREAALQLSLQSDDEYQNTLTELRRLNTEEAMNNVAIDVIHKVDRILLKDLDLLVASVEAKRGK